MSLTGVAELDRKLGELKKSVQGNILRSAVRAGIKPAADRFKATIAVGSVPHRTYKGRLVGPGFARRSIRVITTVNREKTQAAAILGVRKEAFYEVQFIERGFRGIPGRPALEPAMQSTQSAQVEALGRKLKERIEAVAR